MILEAKKIHKKFPGAHVLRDISFEIHESETVAIMGKSGEGKSTLLHILGTLDTPTSGSLKICGKVPTAAYFAKIRNEQIGFIFQFYHLLEDFTVLENVVMPLKISRSNDEKRAQMLIEAVGLKGKEKSLTKHLSGGEKQRVAIARALVTNPKLILADEPTGNLDETNSRIIQKLLLSLAKESNTAVVIVTHDEEFAKLCDRRLFLKEGQLYNARA